MGRVNDSIGKHKNISTLELVLSIRRRRLLEALSAYDGARVDYDVVKKRIVELGGEVEDDVIDKILGGG
jgi:hypothetical protein